MNLSKDVFYFIFLKLDGIKIPSIFIVFLFICAFFEIRYGEPVIRRAVPLALALISPSNPQLNILETLSKFSHDSDVDTARNAIFALGLVGAGTNNARLVSMLRQLASYHAKDQVGFLAIKFKKLPPIIIGKNMQFRNFH